MHVSRISICIPLRYADLAWGAASGLLAFKLSQDKNLPQERHLQQLIRRGYHANLQQQAAQAEIEAQAIAAATAEIEAEEQQHLRAK